MKNLILLLSVALVSVPALATKTPVKPIKKPINKVTSYLSCRIQQKQTSEKGKKEVSELVEQFNISLRQAKGYKQGEHSVKLVNPERKARISARYGAADGLKNVLEIQYSDTLGADVMEDNVVEKAGKTITTNSVSMNIDQDMSLNCELRKKINKKSTKGSKKPVKGEKQPSKCPGKKLCKPTKK